MPTATQTYSPRVSEWKLKEQMCDIGRRIWLKGFCAGNEGNHSFRLSENRVLCTPTGISKGFLNPDDICTVDLEGKQVAGKRKRTSEILMHLAIYKARPDVKAVVHSHPPHATAFAVAGVELPTCIHPEAEVFLGAVKTAKYVTPGDTRLGESLMPYCYFPLQRSGALPKIEAAGFTRKYSVQFVSINGRGSQPFYFFQHFDPPAAVTWKISRRPFGVLVTKSRVPSGESATGRNGIVSKLMKGLGP